MPNATIVAFLLAAGLIWGDRQVNAMAVDATPQTAAPSEKASRTPAQQKIDSRLLDEVYRRQGKPARSALSPGQTLLKVDLDGRALVDIRAEVTPALRKSVTALKGTIVSTSTEYRSIIAWLPLLKLEEVAADPAVHSIMPAPEPIRPEPLAPRPPAPAR
jgi:hypothetical protein